MEIVHIVRPHHLIVILHFDIFICCCSFAVDTGTYLSPHKPNMTAVLFVQFTSQTNTHVVDQYAPHIHMHLTTRIPRHYYPPLTYTDTRCISFSSLTKVCCCIINTLDMSPTKPRASKSDELINKYAAAYQLIIRIPQPTPFTHTLLPCLTHLALQLLPLYICCCIFIPQYICCCILYPLCRIICPK